MGVMYHQNDVAFNIARRYFIDKRANNIDSCVISPQPYVVPSDMFGLC